jgi:DNA-binding response OmpR family regulator
MSQILVVEDDPDIAELVAHYAEKAGHKTERVSSGTAGLARVRASRPDLVVLDVMLPGLSGLVVCEAMRADPTLASIPIIMLTARADEADRIAGLELGADDYVTKPFSPRELVARIGALLRRVARSQTRPVRQQFGPIEIDADRHLVIVDGREVKLTAKEFLLLEYLVQHQGRVLSRDLLLSDVWGYQYTGGTRTVDVHVSRLREKIPFLADTLQTVKQFGYKLADASAFG